MKEIDILEKIFNVSIIVPTEPYNAFQQSTLLSDLQMIIDQNYPAIILPRDILFNKKNLKARQALVEYKKIDIIIYLPAGYIAGSDKESILLIFKQPNVAYRGRHYFESILYGEYKDNCLSNLRNIPFGLIVANEYKLNML